jgi:type II secretion system protein G
MLKQKKGFTLIELLIVIVIIGILAVIVAGMVVNNGKQRANDAKAKSDLNKIQAALELYRTEEAAATYPAALSGLVPTYMTELPKRPDNGQDYTYTPTDGNTKYTLEYTLQNSGDKGPNVTAGVFQLHQGQ